MADRFDLRRDIRFKRRVIGARYDEDSERWIVRTDKGEQYVARYLIAATGCLSSRLKPHFNGLETFRGRWYYTAAWPRAGVDFAGMSVGIVGTGSTAIQAIPQVARQADHIYVFQRTPNFSVPARNVPLTDDMQRNMKERYPAHREAARRSAFGVPVVPNEQSALEVAPEQVKAELDARWQHGGGASILRAFADVLQDERANTIVADYVREKIRRTVRDQRTAEMLCPYDHPIGTKRICVDINYYETYNRENVTLVDIRNNPIQAVISDGVRLENGEAFALDAIIFAIGFDAMTGALFDMNLCGREGVRLADKWAEGPKTYLGLMTTSFPNLFLITRAGESIGAQQYGCVD